MPRKSVGTAHVNLRIRDSLRDRLVREAEGHHFSLNNEIRVRLERSLEGDEHRSIEEIAAHMRNSFERFDQAFHELNKQGDLLRAAETLVKAIEQDDQDAIKTAVVQACRQVRRRIDCKLRWICQVQRDRNRSYR